MTEFTASLCQFLNESHSPYHAQTALRRTLNAEGYVNLPEGDDGNLTPGGKYYVCRGGAAGDCIPAFLQSPPRAS